MWGFPWNIFTKKEKVMQGADISHYNSIPDFSKVKGLDFLFVKATEGIGYVDPKLSYNANGAVNNNIRVGYYHFGKLNNPQSEAQHFLSAIGSMPLTDIPLCLDIEENSLHIQPPQMLGWINAFFNYLSSQNHNSHLLYSYPSFLNSNLPANHDLGSVPLWVASYRSTPELPKGWSKYTLWQYDNKGSVPGIIGPVDLDKGNI